MTLAYELRHRVFVLALLFVSACANPFSSQKPATLSNYHPGNIDCNQLDLSTAEITNDQIRKVTECLNSNQEINAFEQMLRWLPDDQLSPIVRLLNQTSTQNPKYLFAVKEGFFHFQNEGKIAALEKNLLPFLSDTQKTNALADALKTIRPDLISLLKSENPEIHLKNTLSLMNSAAYQRLFLEQHPEGALTKIGVGIKHYLEVGDGLNLSALTQVLSKAHLGDALAALTQDHGPEHLEHLDGFLEWLLDSERYHQLSSSIHSLLNENVKCFQDKITIPSPLDTVIHDLKSMSASEAKQFLKHDLKNLLLTSQGYCTFPFSLNGIARVASEAADVPGFDEFFSLLKPLLSDARFVAFAASNASATFVAENQYLKNNHLLLDFITLLAINQDQPLFGHGETIATFLDRSLTKLTPPQTQKLFELLDSALTKESGFGAKTVQLIFEISNEFPEIEIVDQQSTKNILLDGLNQLLSYPNLNEVFDLGFTLIQSQKLDSIVGEALQLFNHFLDRGRFAILYHAVVLPTSSESSDTLWRLKKPLPPVFPDDECSQLDFDWKFDVYPNSSSTDYRKQLSLISKCIDPNPTFKAGMVLADHAIAHQEMTALLELQNIVISTLFQTDSELNFQGIFEFLHISTEENGRIHAALTRLADTAHEIKDTLKHSTEFKKYLAIQIKNPDFFGALSEIIKQEYPRADSEIAPLLDLQTLEKIRVIVDRGIELPMVSFEEGLTQLMQHYCPTLNPSSPDCKVDTDQIQAFNSNPRGLANAIKNEYLNSSQTWIHPLLMKEWEHTTDTPVRISQVEYHLHPLHQLFQNNEDATRAVFSALDRLKSANLDLFQFLKDRSTQLVLVPFIFHEPGYPKTSRREYHSKIRFRIVSQIDRLELLAIEADFKALGLTHNFGLGFIKDIALSWGDEPKSARPTDLGAYTTSPKTLKDTAISINDTLTRFDRSIVQGLGKLDPDIADISARLFNNRFLISLLDEELPVEQGGKNGLRVIRDLFYSLYSMNQNSQRDHFPNGLSMPSKCFSDPLMTGALSECNFDLMTLISRLSRLGALHQIGVHLLQDQKSSLGDLFVLLNRTHSRLQDKITRLAHSKQALLLSNSLTRFAFETNSSVSRSMPPVMKVVSRLDATDWGEGLIDLLAFYPELISDYQPLIEPLLAKSDQNISRLSALFFDPSAPHFKSWLNQLSHGSELPLATELSGDLRDLSFSVKKLTPILEQSLDAPPVDSKDLNLILTSWLDVYSTDRGVGVRNRLADWINSTDFQHFCDLLGDPELVDDTYGFLAAINQNSDSRRFLERCSDFLHIH